MKIKKISKVSKTRYKIDFIDAQSIITYDKVILENNILLKKEIDIDTYMKMQQENGYYEIYNKVVKYIVIKLRSEKEIREYIKKYTEDKNMIDEIIAQLKKEGLLNDDRYIKAFIEDKVNLTNWGPNKIERELEKLNIDTKKVRQILSSYNDEIFDNKIKKIISKKVKANKKDSMYMLKQKLERELFNLGYSKDLIKENTANLFIDETKLIGKEIMKLYKKLSIKYNDEQLRYQLKQKLQQKGFSSDIINETIDEYLIEE